MGDIDVSDAEEVAGRLAPTLARGTWTHDHAMSAVEAKSLFPQPTRTRPSAEYLPPPRRGAPHRA